MSNRGWRFRQDRGADDELRFELILLVAVLAAYLPARRAARLDPLAALGQE